MTWLVAHLVQITVIAALAQAVYWSEKAAEETITITKEVQK